LKDQCATFLDSILATSTNGTHTGLDNMSVIVVRVLRYEDKVEDEKQNLKQNQESIPLKVKIHKKNKGE
jgi:hypothetical protein